LRNNCEHFCNWCLAGVPRSAQIESLTWSLRLLVRAAEGLTLLAMIGIWAAARSCKTARIFFAPALSVRPPDISLQSQPSRTGNA
jgi:hypothetical protein